MYTDVQRIVGCIRKTNHVDLYIHHLPRGVYWSSPHTAFLRTHHSSMSPKYRKRKYNCDRRGDHWRCHDEGGERWNHGCFPNGFAITARSASPMANRLKLTHSYRPGPWGCICADSWVESDLLVLGHLRRALPRFTRHLSARDTPLDSRQRDAASSTTIKGAPRPPDSSAPHRSPSKVHRGGREQGTYRFPRANSDTFLSRSIHHPLLLINPLCHMANDTHGSIISLRFDIPYLRAGHRVDIHR